MPRIYDQDNEPIDFCMECYAEEIEEDYPHAEFNAPHPSYNEDNFYCEVCGVALSAADNEADPNEGPQSNNTF